MDGLLTVAMIVKDEERFLPECLASIKGVADEIIVVDTGSQDRTVEIAHGFGARVVEIEWPQDFAIARNVGLDLVKTPWVLVMDADEELIREDIPVLENALKKPIGEAYNIRIVSVMDRVEDIAESYVSRLFRSHPGVRFEGNVHEQIFPSLIKHSMRLVSLNVRLLHKGYLGSVVTHRNKTERNRQLLEKHLRENPDDGYMWWQLAQTHLGAGEYESGLKASRRALSLIAMDHPLWVLAQTTYARLLDASHQPKRALKALDEGQTAFPTYTDFHYLEGLIHMNLKQWGKAEKAFRKCLDLGEAQGYLMTDTGVGGFKALFKLAQALSLQGRSKEGLAVLLITIKNHPNFRDAWQGTLTLLAGSTFDAVLDTLCLTIPLETIAATLGSWSNLSEDESNLLKTAELRLASPQN